MMNKFKIVYQDDNLLVTDKLPGMSVFPEGEEKNETFIDILIGSIPNLKNVGKAPRHGIVHRLDKDTSGILLIAKNDRSLEFFQERFRQGDVKKEYVALCTGIFSENEGAIETLMARSPKDRRKQKAFPLYDIRIKGKARKATTDYQVLKKFRNYTLIKAIPHTGRKHQIRCHMTHIGHPIAGDDLYGFRDRSLPEELNRQFLHAESLEVSMPDGEKKKFRAELPDDLKRVLDNLQKNEQ